VERQDGSKREEETRQNAAAKQFAEDDYRLLSENDQP